MAVSAYNLMLRKGPDFGIYVRWLRGQMVRTRRDGNPIFDDPDSFFLNIKTGVYSRRHRRHRQFPQRGGGRKFAAKEITLLADGDQIKLKGTLHKFVSVPIELLGSVGATQDNLIQLHVTKLNVLKTPFKSLLSGLHITLTDLFHPQSIPGIQVSITMSFPVLSRCFHSLISTGS